MPILRRAQLVVCAGVITFAALGIGWTHDCGADASPSVQDAGVDATVPLPDPDDPRIGQLRSTARSLRHTARAAELSRFGAQYWRAHNPELQTKVNGAPREGPTVSRSAVPQDSQRAPSAQAHAS